MESKLSFELDDDILDAISGGTNVPEEDRWLGWCVRSDRRCPNCYNQEFRIVSANGERAFDGVCLNCGSEVPDVCPVYLSAGLSAGRFEVWQG